MSGCAGGTCWWIARRLATAHDTVTLAGFAGAGACVVVIVGSFCYEVLARYFFSAPTVWANALASYALCGMIFLALPQLTRLKAHITVTVLLERLSPERATSLQRVIWAVSAIACLFAAWFSADATISQYRHGIHTISAWPIPKWLLSMVIPYGLLSAGIYLLRQVVSNGRKQRATEGQA